MFTTRFGNKRNILLFNRMIVCLFLMITASCQASTPPPNMDPPGGITTIGIGIDIARRYIDGNNNGVIDMPNTASYAQSPLHVTLNVSDIARSYPSKWPYENVDSAGFGSTIGPWRWTFSPREDGTVPQGLAKLPIPTSAIDGLTATNDGQKIVTYSGEPILTIDLFEGKWAVELARLDSSGNVIYWKTKDVGIEDILIVQLGDSYSAGQGAPDRDAQGGYWGDDGTGQNGDHPNADRSSYSWGSMAALQIQDFVHLYRDQSVTYINLAESGALIEDLPVQLHQLSTLVDVRKVDVVFISIGGNDAGFYNAIAAYLLHEPIDNFPDRGPSIPEIEDAIQTGDWTNGKFSDVGSVLLQIINSRLPSDLALSDKLGLDDLDVGYENVATMLKNYGISPINVFILQYPDPFVADSGDPDAACPDSILHMKIVLSGLPDIDIRIGGGEQRSAREYLVKRLNQQIATSAQLAGWNVVDGETAFYKHAICQAEGRMVNTLEDSISFQGNPYGVLHPNRSGYEVLGKSAFGVWAVSEQKRP